MNRGIRILQTSQKITDLPPYQHLRGQTLAQIFGYSPESVEQIFGHSETRLDEVVGGEATRQTLIVHRVGLSTCATEKYNVFYHEFAHLLHLTLLLKGEFWHLEELYKSAIKEGRYLDDYAANNSSEYFAQGLEAYFSVSKSLLDSPIFFNHTREDLEEKDPKLLAFIESLIDDKISLEDFETPCSFLFDGNVSYEDYDLEDPPSTDTDRGANRDSALEYLFSIGEDPHSADETFYADEGPLSTDGTSYSADETLPADKTPTSTDGDGDGVIIPRNDRTITIRKD